MRTFVSNPGEDSNVLVDAVNFHSVSANTPFTYHILIPLFFHIWCSSCRLWYWTGVWRDRTTCHVTSSVSSSEKGRGDGWHEKEVRTNGWAGEWAGEHGLEALSLPTNLDDDSKKKRIATEESENSLRMDCKRLGKTRDHEHAKYKSF